MKRSRTITFHWRTEGLRPLTDEQLDELDEVAVARIAEQIPQGFTEGMLDHSFSNPDMHFRGSWDFS
jgi:hypothetical protein